MALAAAALLGLAAPALAQDDRTPNMTRCVTCHLASPSSSDADKAGQWLASAHARRGVGCEACHGGDPVGADSAQSHRGILAPANPRSPVYAANLPATCGACHRANAIAFASSMHQTLVVAGDRRAPTCVTCHGSMGTVVPTPAVLETRCTVCHRAGTSRGAYPALLREAVERLNGLRARAEEVAPRVVSVGARARRVELLGDVYDLKQVLNGAVGRLHAFSAAQVIEQLDIAQQRLDAITRSLAAAADADTGDGPGSRRPPPQP